MNCSKIATFFLALLIWFSNTSSTIVLHFCKDTIASISLFYTADEPCQTEENSCCSKEKEHSSCCSDKVIKIEKKGDNFFSKSEIFQPIIAFLPSNKPIILVSNNVLESKNKKIDYYYHSNAPPNYKLYCQLIFYA